MRIVQWSSNVSVNTLSIVEIILLPCVCCDYFFGTENTEFIVIYVQGEKLARNYCNVMVIKMSTSIFVCVLLSHFVSVICAIFFMPRILPTFTQNIAQKPKQYKCAVPFSIIYPLYQPRSLSLFRKHLRVQS